MSDYDREKWNGRYSDPEAIAHTPSVLLTSLVDLLPGGGRALDVAGGGGRHAIWLAEQGYDTSIVDVSPVGLALCQQRAATANVSLTDICLDLETDPIPAGPWDVIVSFCFLKRSIFPAMISALADGGMLVFCQPTQSNLQRHAKPPTDFLLNDGELPSLVAGLEIIRLREGWLEEGRHDAIVVARKPYTTLPAS